MDKCNHGPNARCLKCMGKTPQKTQKPAKWLCQHPPGQKCVNCLGVKKAAEAPRKCTHPPNMKCPNCLPAEKPAEKTPPHIYFPERCPNHGPNGSCTMCLAKKDAEKIRVAKQDAVCRLCSMNFFETRNFQQYIFQRNFYVNRYGILFGTFVNDNVRVEAIYEPPQMIDNERFVVTQEQAVLQATNLAAEFGLVRVGVIFSHNGKRKEILRSWELVEAARRQLDWDRRCVTVVVLPNDKNTSSKVECFQASEQLTQLVAKGLVVDAQPNPASLVLKESIYLAAREVLEVDPVVFVTNVPVKAFKQHMLFSLSTFPVENRPEGEVTIRDFKTHFTKYANLPLPEQLADFHLLVFCVEFSIFTSLTDVRRCLLNHVDVPSVKEDVKVWMEIPTED